MCCIPCVLNDIPQDTNNHNNTYRTASNPYYCSDILIHLRNVLGYLCRFPAKGKD